MEYMLYSFIRSLYLPILKGVCQEDSTHYPVFSFALTLELWDLECSTGVGFKTYVWSELLLHSMTPDCLSHMNLKECMEYGLPTLL